ncbi:unnamed protein product, partial [Didymodactylos carnosus]
YYVTYNDLYRNLFDFYPLYMGILMLLMLIWSVIYMILAIYIERINPGEFGVALPWYYIFQSLNCYKRKVSPSSHRNSAIELRNIDNKWFQTKSESTQSYVSIKNLTKKFKKFYAVSNLSLEFYQNEVCCLLGHNGAGMLESDNGDITVDGMNITSNIQNIRKKIGFCPQYDILYDELSVKEHLELIAKMRHIDRHQIDSCVDDILRKINLVNDKQTLAKNLSGGMKRRLSVGLSLIGDPQVLIFDEPTSGIGK